MAAGTWISLFESYEQQLTAVGLRVRSIPTRFQFPVSVPENKLDCFRTDCLSRAHNHVVAAICNALTKSIGEMKMECSKIAWTDHTFNAWIGCTRVSSGCIHCYAETQNAHYKWNGGSWGPGSPRKVTGEEYWRQPLRWNRQAAQSGTRARVFCASLSDVFDPEAPDGVRERLWNLILRTSNLDWLLLTKRPENFDTMLPDRWATFHNVWLGVTCENHKQGFPRVEILRNTPAVVRFISAEPLLEDISEVNLHGIEWVICGGESGAHAREFKTEWARNLRDACIGKNFFMKQLGSFVQIATAKGEKKDLHGTNPIHFPVDLRVQTWPR